MISVNGSDRTCSLRRFVPALVFDTGSDEVLAWLNEEYAQSEGWLKPHQRYGSDVHGLLIIPDDDNTLFPYSQAQVTVTSDPERFLEAMHELADQPSITEPAIALPVRLLNLARVNSQPLARIVLAVSAVEMIVQGQDWTDEQRKSSKRQKIKRVLDDNSLDHLWGEWNDLYERRSRLFHGDREFTNQEIQKLASDATKLCSKIILAIIQQNGAKLPSVASTNFGEI